MRFSLASFFSRSMYIFQLVFLGTRLLAQDAVPGISQAELLEEMDEILYDISHYYTYWEDKAQYWNCLRVAYNRAIKEAKTEEEVVLVFEYLLYELHDSHLILNTNRQSSYRLFSPVYAQVVGDKVVIRQVWQSQLEAIPEGIIGAEILKMNERPFAEQIAAFPTQCHDKNIPEVREWVANKVLAGRYNEARVLELRLKNRQLLKLNLDSLKVRQDEGLLTIRKEGDIGIIRINNQLGNNELIPAFDEALNQFQDTQGLILDLRNTVDGGNTYVARGIMGRFVDAVKPYQKHWILEEYLEDQKVVRSWIEYVSPRKEHPHYDKPLVVLVGRWTGSMGEGLAIGLEASAQAKVMGTEMERLAGSMKGFSFRHLNFGYRLSTQKLFHINGSPREKYIPSYYISPENTQEDEILRTGIHFLEKRIGQH